MCFPAVCYQVDDVLTAFFSHLRPAERRGLLLWVVGTVLAASCSQSAVIAVLLPLLGGEHAIRQRLREWLRDGEDKVCPCATQLEVGTCFVPLLRWILTWWQSRELALAVDVTYHGDRFRVIVLSVLYRGAAIPVAWQVRRTHEPGAWMPIICALLRQLGPAIPVDLTVLVLVDRGLRSGTLWRQIHALGFHPLLRLYGTDTFRPAGWRTRRPVSELVRTPGHAWIGQGRAFSRDHVRGTVLVLWQGDAPERICVLTDGAPEEVGILWYTLRMWVELGFRALKGVGLHWERTRRTDPDRAARHWLVLAVALTWIMATGTRVEEAGDAKMLPAHLHVPPRTETAPPMRVRRHSIVALGRAALAQQFHRGRLWRRVWFTPEAWPTPPPDLILTVHDPAIPEAA